MNLPQTIVKLPAKHNLYKLRSTRITMSKETRYWIDLLGKISIPLFVSVTVACLLSKTFETIHLILMLLALLFIYINHHYTFHTK